MRRYRQAVTMSHDGGRAAEGRNTEALFPSEVVGVVNLDPVGRKDFYMFVDGIAGELQRFAAGGEHDAIAEAPSLPHEFQPNLDLP